MSIASLYLHRTLRLELPSLKDVHIEDFDLVLVERFYDNAKCWF